MLPTRRRLQGRFCPDLPYHERSELPLVNAGLGVKTLPNSLTRRRQNPAWWGIGMAQHLADGLLKAQAKIKIDRPPYCGAGPGATANLSGEAPIGFASVSSVFQHIQSDALLATLYHHEGTPQLGARCAGGAVKARAVQPGGASCIGVFLLG